MRSLRCFHNQRIHLKMIAGLFILVASIPQAVYASLPIPKVETPVIWKEAGQALEASWAVRAQEWLYMEAGEVRPLERKAIVEDLRRGSWSGITIDSYIDYLKSVDDPSGTSLFTEIMIIEQGFPILSIKANQGPWRLLIHIFEGDSDGDVGNGNPRYYIATITHESHFRADITRLMIDGYQALPGAELVDAYFSTADGERVGVYRFRTLSPMEAVVAHHARQNDWEIRSLGELGALGYSEQISAFLWVYPSTDEVEETFYTIMYDGTADFGESGEW